MMDIQFPDDMYFGTEDRPQCEFFDVFPSSLSPWETFFGLYYCNLMMEEECAHECKGDPACCPAIIVDGAVRSKGG
jgi:hypothetical protein